MAVPERLLEQRKEYKRIIKAREDGSENLQDDIKKLINNVYGEEGRSLNMTPEQLDFMLGKIGDHMRLATINEEEKKKLAEVTITAK